MTQRQREVEAALRAAADLPEETAEPVENSEKRECRAKDPSKCRVHGDARKNDGAWEPMSKEESDAEDFANEWAGKRTEIAEKSARQKQARLYNPRWTPSKTARRANRHLKNTITSIRLSRILQSV